MKTLFKSNWWKASLAVCVLATGCSKDDKVAVYPTEGVLRLEGEPIGPTTIRLIPMEKGGKSAVGEVDAQGKIKFTTYQIGDGAPAGVFRVAVGAGVDEPIKPYPVIYRDMMKSPLQTSVDAQPGNNLVLDMKLSAGPVPRKNAQGKEDLTNKAYQSEAFSAGASTE